MSSVFDQVIGYLRSIPPAPVAARLEVGILAHDLLTRASMSGVSGWVPPTSNGVAAIFGLPVVPNPAMDAPAWRTLDRDGKVIDRGLMSP